MNSKQTVTVQFSNEEVLKAWSWKGDFCVSKRNSVLERMDGMVTERIICFQSGIGLLEEAHKRLDRDKWTNKHSC